MRTLSGLPLILVIAGCEPDRLGDSGDTAALSGTATGSGTTGTTTGVTGSSTFEGYDFESRFAPQTSSVAHSGQTMRQVLIRDMKLHLGGMTQRLDNGQWFPAPGDATAELDFFFAFDGASSGQVPIGLTTDPSAEQVVYGDISTSANLVGKLAGNDPVGQHEDWSTALVGWDEAGVTTPESLVRHWFQQVDSAAVARMNGDVPLGPTGAPVPEVYVTADGHDLQQLVEKFLHGAISFSQAADDYLDDDLAEKGLNSDNTAPDDGEPYTALEHAWDEGFAYFGASHYYAEMSDSVIAETGWVDQDGNGSIDLGSEICFGASLNAAKRDLAAVAATEFTDEAWQGFYEGRALITSADGALNATEMDVLKAHRDRAVRAWEKALAATVVHYINATLQDMETFGSNSYSFASHAKHWSEMKGFALAFQFNPRSPLTDAQFADLHEWMGQEPVLPGTATQTVSDYREDLIQARTLLGSAYGFDVANLGDDDGLNGW